MDLKRSEISKQTIRASSLLASRQPALKEHEPYASLADLIEGVAHELNNNIAVALGHVQLLKFKIRDESLNEGLNRIEKSIANCARLIKSIQGFNSQSDRLSHDLVDAGEELQNVLAFDEAIWKTKAVEKNLTITVQGVEEKYPLELNKNDLLTALSHLLHNAVDASPINGKIAVNCILQTGLVSIEIADTGPGISEEIKAKIYEPFFTTKKSKGSGLGLTVVQSIVSRYGGRISFKANRPSGSVFTLSFPAAAINSTPEINREAPNADADKRILIVDDDDEVRKVLSEMLAIEGYIAENCSDAYSAMEMLEKGTYHMIITDLGMPGMSGYDLAEYVQDKYKDIEVVLLTGWGSSLKKEGRELKGIKTVLSKPFRLAQVLDLVRN